MKVIPVKYIESNFVLSEDCALDETWEFVCEHELYYDKHEDAVICYNNDCTGFTEDESLQVMLHHYDMVEEAESEY